MLNGKVIWSMLEEQVFHPWEGVALSLNKNVRYRDLIHLVDEYACACRPRGGSVKGLAKVGGSPGGGGWGLDSDIWLECDM